MKRANLLIALGAVLVLVGLVVAWAIGRSDDDSAAPEAQVSVVMARADLSRGERGADLVAAGKVAVEQVPVSEATPGAISSVEDLEGSVLGSPVAEGAQISSVALRSATLRGGSITLPDGLQAVAVTVPFTNGGAGYIAPGDRVDVYVTIPPGAQGAPTAPYTQILLTSVEVLDTSTEVAPRRAEASTAGSDPAASSSRPGGEQITLLLAVSPADGERLVFAASVNQLWFGLMGDDPPPSESGGVTYGASYLGGD